MQKRFAGWDALDKAIQVEGWKLIILLRISPLVPYNVLNVMLGSSGITFKTFAFFSTVGAVPLHSAPCARQRRASEHPMFKTAR